MVNRFVDSEFKEKPMVFEVFTDWKNESDALYAIKNILADSSIIKKNAVKKAVKGIVGESGYNVIKKLIRK